MPRNRLFSLLKQTFKAWNDDYVPSMGASLAYYTMFSIAPVLLIAITVAGMVFGEDAARGALVEQLRGLMGSDGAHAVEGLLASVSRPATGIIATLFGVVVLVIGATSVFAELQNALDRIWKVPDRETPSGIWNLLRTRLLAFGMIMGIAFLLMISLVLSAALAALGHWWGPYFGSWEASLQAANMLVSFLVITAAFAIIYKAMPKAPVAWRDVWLGAGITAVLFEIGKLAIGLYIGKSGVASGFGAAASLVVMMIWVYYSSQIFLLGAEFTRVCSHRNDPDKLLRADLEAPAPVARPQPRVHGAG